MMRIDKWLWCVRLFKTRTLATDACKAGKIKINDEAVKASREIKVGDVIAVRQGALHLVVKVKELIEMRVGAKLVVNCMEDLTPQEEYEKVKMIAANTRLYHDGKGRPTKKDRRTIDRLLNK